MGDRKDPTKEVEKQVLVASRRRCCICYGLHKDLGVKQGQLAHLNRDPSDSSAENLAFMCLDHHDWFDSKTSQSKGPTIEEARHYRDILYAKFAADDEAELAGTAAAAPVSPSPLEPSLPFFADDELLNIRWIVRARPESWLNEDLRLATPRQLQQILDGPLHAAPDCLERLAEHEGMDGTWRTLMPECPGCGVKIFQISHSLPLEDRFTQSRVARLQAISELQRLHRAGVPIVGPRVVLKLPQYWRTMEAIIPHKPLGRRS